MTRSALVVGGFRQRRTADALRRGSFAALASPLVTWLTAVAIILSITAMVLVATAF